MRYNLATKPAHHGTLVLLLWDKLDWQYFDMQHEGCCHLRVKYLGQLGSFSKMSVKNNAALYL